MTKHRRAVERRVFWLGYVAPVGLLLLFAVFPLISGERTLFLRDVLNTHYEMKLAQADAWREGRLPLVDPWRSSGQGHLGNPNTTTLYPDSALLAVASPLWVLNARFWIHWLLAPFAFAWLARSWGIGREAAFAGGVCYAASGFFLSQLNLHNLIAGVTLAPALAAAALGVAAGRRAGAGLLALGLLWALVLLSGDPMTAALALAAALAAVGLRFGPRPPRLGRLAAALGLGTLVAAPQIVEFLRLLPATFRGVWGYSSEAAAAASLHPAAAIEWLLPLFFGPPDVGFWGARFFTGGSPLYYSLYPGVLALALIGAAVRARNRAAGWSWGLVAAGLFLALGANNPAAAALLRMSGGLARLPVKFWLWVALGASLLCAVGFERLLAGRSRRAFALVLTAAATIYAIWWAVSASGAGVALVEALLPGHPSPETVSLERARWVALAATGLVVTLALGFAAFVARHRPAFLGLLLAVHVAGQLFLLAPLRVADEVAFYERPPAALAAIPPGARVVQGQNAGLFGPVRFEATAGERGLSSLQRRLHETLAPYALVRWGRAAALAPSPEGLDAFVSKAAAQAMPRLDDDARLRLLAASGVRYLVLSRPLSAPLLAPSPVWRGEVAGAPLSVYEVPGAAPPVRLATKIHRAAGLREALERVVDRGFESARETVLAGDGPATESPPGRLLEFTEEAERLTARVEAAGPSALVWQRAPLPLYAAWLNGEPAPIVVADLHRLAVEVPSGVHSVEIRVDRGPLTLSIGAALAALLALVALAWRLGADDPRTDRGGISSADAR